MKKPLSVLGFLIFAVLMLPGLIRPPAETTTKATAHVQALAHAVSMALLEYREKSGHFPEGGSGQIMAELRAGGFLEPALETLNDRGELLDPWGTPFRISLDRENQHPVIESAGPNLTFDKGLPMAFMSNDDHSYPR